MCKIARDFQRNKVYAAEGSIWNDQMPPVGSGSLLDVRDYAQEIMMSDSWARLCRKYGRCTTRPFVVMESGRTRVMCTTAAIRFPSYEASIEKGFNMRQPWVICHEMAHMATFHLLYTQKGQIAAHGPEFADAYVDLVTGVLGKNEGKRLFDAFERHGVKQKVTAVNVPSNEQMEDFYLEYDESWKLERYVEYGKALMVGGAQDSGVSPISD